MSKRHPLIPKGKAMALHLTEEYTEGINASTDINPYDFFDEPMKHTAWCYGSQRKTK
jgi:hypothetical protein